MCITNEFAFQFGAKFTVHRFVKFLLVFVLGARRHDLVAPVLMTLHWLPVRKRVMFKTAMLVWKYLNGTAPGYLFELCVSVASASQVSLDGLVAASS